MRFAMRVEAAMERAKGSWYVTEARVARMLCAARVDGPKRLEASVRISKARYSASIMIIPGTARRIMTPGGNCQSPTSTNFPKGVIRRANSPQFLNARQLKPPQH